MPLTTPCSIRITILTLLAALLVCCASGPQTGVRAEFERQQVDKVAIVPFYSSSSFGIDAERFDTINAHYERAAEHALAEQGFQVVDSRTLRHTMTEYGFWDDFTDGVRLRQSITEYFEPPGPGDSRSIEMRTIRELAAQAAFPAPALLFGEIVYHSHGTCRTEADDFASHARVEFTSSAPDELPRPCVSSHFQAKLVDISSGETMWFNRVFLETHTDESDNTVVEDTIAAAVETAIRDDDGPAALAPSAHDKPRAGSH